MQAMKPSAFNWVQKSKKKKNEKDRFVTVRALFHRPFVAATLSRLSLSPTRIKRNVGPRRSIKQSV